jgi:hypothetical protein
MSDTSLTGDLENKQWLDWYLISPQDRWRVTERLWQSCLSVAGSLEPESDPQSSFFGPDTLPAPAPVDGRPGVCVTRRSGV